MDSDLGTTLPPDLSPSPVLIHPNQPRSLRVPYRRETTESQLSLTKPHIHDFELVRLIGSGSYGRVYLAKYLPSDEPVVLKFLSKSEVIENQQIARVFSEKQILRLLQSPFIVGYLNSFQDSDYLYLALEYVPGGELFKLMLDNDRFDVNQTRFYAAEIAYALCDLHAINCLYRDLKPENVVITRTGHIKLTDFGSAKIINFSTRTYTLCGTPEYIAPEIVDCKGHTVNSDWWQLGILVYEMMAAYPPFSDHSPYELYGKILISKVEYPKFFDAEAISFIGRLLVKDPDRRMNASTVKSHPFFSGIDWNAVHNRLLPPPFLPTVTNSFDSHNFDTYDENHVNSAVPVEASDLFAYF